MICKEVTSPSHFLFNFKFIRKEYIFVLTTLNAVLKLMQTENFLAGTGLYKTLL